MARTLDLRSDTAGYTITTTADDRRELKIRGEYDHQLFVRYMGKEVGEQVDALVELLDRLPTGSTISAYPEYTDVRRNDKLIITVPLGLDSFDDLATVLDVAIETKVPPDGPIDLRGKS